MAAKDTVSRHPAETRMLLDELVRRLADETTAPTAAPPFLGPFITLSRQAGIPGREIARAVAAELGWTVLDRELVDNLARELELDPHRLRLMDETRTNWFRDTVLNLMDSRLVLQDSYVALLGKVMALAAHRGKVVIVGRGGHLLLPRDLGLRVRVVGQREWRSAHLAALEGLGSSAAEERLDVIDAARAEFLRRNFKTNPDEPASYDLILDVSTLGEGAVVSLVCEAARVRRLV
jgi:cytidylate kinase